MLEVQTKYGIVKGFVKDGLCQWFGIPYAKPPLKDLRFRRAVECEPWENVKDCTKFGGHPYQFKFESILGTKMDTEDCLYLNIWRKNNNEKNLPVDVWIHGGYLHCFSATDSVYHGNHFAENGVLFVSFDYRMGPLGCYDLSIYDKEEFDSNCTLSDEIMALKWVNENIEAFGGDPHNITIHGESAGGASVLALMTSPAAKGLFQKAICQSGYPDGHHSAKSSKLLMDMFLEYLNIKPEEVKKIKDLDIKTLQSASDYVLKNLPKYPGIIWPGFVYDDLLPEDWMTTLKNGSADGVKLLIGTTKDEGTLFNSLHECPKSKEEIQKMFENNDLSDKFPIIEEFYYKEKKGGDSTPECNFGKDYIFLLGSLEFADIQSQNNDVYMYRLDFMPTILKLTGYKSLHSIDIFPVFKNYSFLGNLVWFLTRPSSIKILERYMHESWVNFIKTGNPNGDHLTISWEKFDKESRKTLLIDKELSLKDNPEKEIIDLWLNKIKTHRFYK